MSSDHTQPLRKRITQLEAELRVVRQQAKAQRQRLADKYGHEFLALIDGNSNTKVTIIDVVQKLVFQDEEGNTVAETDGSLVGKIIEVRFNLLH